MFAARERESERNVTECAVVVLEAVRACGSWPLPHWDDMAHTSSCAHVPLRSRLFTVIEAHGQRDEAGRTRILFGELFEAYATISETVTPPRHPFAAAPTVSRQRTPSPSRRLPSLLRAQH